MSVNFKIRSNIKRAIETGELLYLDYVNKNDDNTFYFLGIKQLNFEQDKSKITGFSYNYQYKGYKKITIEINRIKDARCVEGTKNFVESKLKNYLKVPEVNKYFTDEINEKHILNYYVDCIENSDDLTFVSTYKLDDFDLKMLKETKRRKLSKEKIDEILKLLNINPEKAREKYKLAFNYECISNQKDEIVPLAYTFVILDVFKQEILIEDDQIELNYKNIAKALKNHNIDGSIYEGHIQQLKDDIQDASLKEVIFDSNPQIFKLKLDLTLSPRKEYQKIKDIIYSKGKLTPVLQAFFGKYQKPALSLNKNVYFINNKVNADQIMSTYSVLNNDLTYVQGPPGTGKSNTIVNMVVSSFLNKETTLITSYTNSAVDNIYDKLKKIKYGKFFIPIPMLRLGSKFFFDEGIKYLRKANDYYHTIRNEFDLTELRKEYKLKIEVEVSKLRKINEVIKSNQKLKDAETKVDYYSKLIDIFKDNRKYKKKVLELSKSRAAQKGQITKINKLSIDNILSELNIDFNVILLGIFIKSIEAFEKLNDDKYSYLKSVIYNEDIEIARRMIRKELRRDENTKMLLDVIPIFLTTNISSRSIALGKPSFDLLIMDEAGQCENAFAIVAMSKAKRAAFIGDPNQLLPVVTLSDTLNNALTYQYSIPEVYNYKKTSILQTLNQIDFINDLIVLKKHYRCRKSIVNFANKKYYNNQLDVQVDKVDAKDCSFIDVKSEFYQNKKNTSMPEVAAILEEIKKIPRDKSIGVISPFKNQSDLIIRNIKQYLPDRNISVGTVHKFQGQEKDTIFLSLAVGKNSYKGSYDWVKDNRQLINVATTRPKERLVVVGDKSSIDKLSEGENSDIRDLINYTSDFNHESFDVLSVGKKYGNITSKHLYTRYEDMFFDTLQRVINIHRKGFRINGQTDVKQILKIDKGHPLYDYATKASFDFLILDKNNNALVAVELCGPEHAYDKTVIRRDEMKNRLAVENGLELLYVYNRDARNYRMLRNMINKVLV